MLSNKQWVGTLAGCLALTLPLCASGWAWTSGSHYTYGVEGVLGATPPPPGWHYRMYNLWYTPDELKDNSGNTVPGNFELDVFASVQRIIHVTDVKILGADYFYDVIIPLVDQEFTSGSFSDSHSFTLGDITLEPFGLMIRPGLTGASYWQFSDDSDEAGAAADQHKKAHALGAEVNVFYLPMLCQVNLRYLQEYGVDNGPEDARFVATLTKSW